MDSSITDSRPMPDVQGYSDARRVAINRVGIQGIKAPVTVVDKSGSAQHTIAEFHMSVFLPQDRKGTHMSRFSQLLTEHRQREYSVANIERMLNEMLELLDSDAGTLKLQFPYFIDKFAPVTGQPGAMDYTITLVADRHDDTTSTSVEISVPVTTLCPCSKEISRYGAHSQRSLITMRVVPSDPGQFFWEELITGAEQQASAQLYSILKREDEKFVTEHAYENPRFVEDLIREVATHLNSIENISSYSIDVENFESIHNHSAWAQVTRGPTQNEHG